MIDTNKAGILNRKNHVGTQPIETVEGLGGELESINMRVDGVEIYSSTGPKVWGYPYKNYYLTGFDKVSVGQNLNVLEYNQGGLIISLIPGNTRDVMYPLVSYDDDYTYATVDAANNIVSIDGKYTPIEPNDAAGASGPMFVEVDGAASSVSAAWAHGSELLRVTYQPNGKNGLFNWLSTERATGFNPKDASWSTIQSSSSDAWPPFIVSAVNDGDGASSIYTGGNHGSDGGSGGDDTARMDECVIYVDGKRALEDEVFSTFASHVRVEWVNSVMAYNTITLGRYVLRQHFKMDLYPGDASAFCEVEALEEIRMSTDNGPQMFSDGYSTILFYDGEIKDRVAIPSGTLTSGVYSSNPAWGMVLGDDLNGYHGVWMDREFAAGDGRYIAGSAGYFRKGGGSKFYSNVVGGGGLGAGLIAGESYEWHGGYVWSPASAAVNIDSAFTFHKRRKPMLGWAATQASEGLAQLPVWASGSDITGLGVCGVSGVKIATTGYSANQNIVEL